jgi:hypothetical protein
MVDVTRSGVQPAMARLWVVAASGRPPPSALLRGDVRPTFCDLAAKVVVLADALLPAHLYGMAYDRRSPFEPGTPLRQHFVGYAEGDRAFHHHQVDFGHGD